MYLIGKTGVGKSTLLETLARQDFEAERGFALIDPHGDLVEPLARQLQAVDPTRVLYLDATDPQQPYGYNPLRRVRADKIPLAVSGMLETLKKIWPDAWGVRMEHVLRNSLYALLERDGSSLPDILALYTDEDYRKSVVREIRNDVVKRFWRDEFEHFPARLRAEACAPIQNKLGALLSDPTLRRILVEPKIDLRFRKLMDDGMILLVNVSKGRLGEESSLILGSLIVSTLGLAAFSRAEAEPDRRRPFFVYLDEFHNFTTLKTYAATYSSDHNYSLLGLRSSGLVGLSNGSSARTRRWAAGHGAPRTAARPGESALLQRSHKKLPRHRRELGRA